jgi:hypothetical protein
MNDAHKKNKVTNFGIFWRFVSMEAHSWTETLESGKCYWDVDIFIDGCGLPPFQFQPVVFQCSII